MRNTSLLQARFYHAIKTAQRAVEEIAKKDVKQMTKILSGSREVREQVERFYNRTQSIASLVKESMAPDLINDILFKVQIHLTDWKNIIQLHY